MATDPRVSFVIPVRNENPAELPPPARRRRGSSPGGDLGDAAMLRCYDLLVAMRLVDREELSRLEAWLAEVA
jgi:hypothetical protein